MAKNDTSLEYTVPFFLKDYSNETFLNIDKIGIPNNKNINRDLFDLVKHKLSLDAYGDTIPSKAAKDLIASQYEVCLNYIYANPIWKKIRDNGAVEILLAYMMETRHYLLAASSRMSSGLAFAWQTSPMSFILSEHLVEEADHAIFFENALENMGCSRELIAAVKPSPITYEWIFLMRSISSRDPLVSAICSGLMESSAKNKEAVKGWHDLLISKKILKANTIEKFYEHVELDIKLGHGSCWEDALLSKSYITADLLKESLNAITIVAEMLDRWFTHLEHGLSGITIETLPSFEPRAAENKKPVVDSFFNGYPVFSSVLLHYVSHGRKELTDTVSKILGHKYFINAAVKGTTESANQIAQTANSTEMDALCYNPSSLKDVSLADIVKQWMIAVNGHALWDEMIDNPTEEMAFGFILENYHYISSSLCHTTSIIYSCPVESIRNDFIRHLQEEEHHGEILKKALGQFKDRFFEIESFRPLPTTLAFTGFLKELAMSDWKAYCIAMAFLQLTLEVKSDKHKKFYETASQQNPKIATLLGSIKKHDELDISLDHEKEIFGMLGKLESLGIVGVDSLERAALICNLCWSFLDGIREHYKKENSVNQRIGWSNNEISWN